LFGIGSEVLKVHDNNVARLPSAEDIHEPLRELNVLKQIFSNKAINKRNVRSKWLLISHLFFYVYDVVFRSWQMICQVWEVDLFPPAHLETLLQTVRVDMAVATTTW
jgi:hypothetical protein